MFKKIKKLLDHYFHLYSQIDELDRLSIQNKEENRILDVYFKNDLTVRSGPFKGMKYISTSFGSQLIPKILGTYEQPINTWITKIINTNYDQIIDIGSAEGYYAIGLAVRMPQTKIIASEISSDALKYLNQLAKLNKVSSNLRIVGKLNPQSLNSLIEEKTLIICDIEGEEANLLDIKIAKELAGVDILVELHDCFVPNITEKIIDEFHHTHKINIIVDYPRTINPDIKIAQISKFMNEKRPSKMRWAFLEAIQNVNH